MVRHCIVEGCTHRIITGRKYCWLHRNYGKAESYRQGGIIDKSTREFYDYHTARHDSTVFSILFVLGIIWIIILIRMGTNHKYFLNTFIFGPFVGLIIGLFIARYVFKVPFQYYRRYKQKIISKDPEYEEWVRGDINDYKRERDWRKNMFK